jgi:hypothetical protein
VTNANGNKNRAEFDKLLIQSVLETIESVLGRSVLEAFAHYIQTYVEITVDEIPAHVDLLFTLLKDAFGVGGDTLGRTIIRRLYQKAGVRLEDTRAFRTKRPAIDYVEELRQRLQNRLGASVAT